MKKTLLLFFFVMVSLLSYAENSTDILAKVDAKLFPKNASYKLSVEVQNDDGRINKQMFLGYKKGGAKNIMLLKEPVKNSGTVHMRRENSIWVYFSTNGKTMKSAFQSITVGEDVSYGDILANDLSYDYDVVSQNETPSLIILTLKPKPKHEGYAKLLVTIDKHSFLIKKREYFALSGTLLKVCEIRETKYDEKGVMTYFKQEFFDPLKDKRNYVVIENITAVKESDIPDKYYNETQMKFFGGF